MLPHYIIIAIIIFHAVVLHFQPNTQKFVYLFKGEVISVALACFLLGLYLKKMVPLRFRRWRLVCKWGIFTVLTICTVILFFHFHSQKLEKRFTYVLNTSNILPKTYSSGGKNGTIYFQGVISRDKENDGHYFSYHVRLEKIVFSNHTARQLTSPNSSDPFPKANTKTLFLANGTPLYALIKQKTKPSWQRVGNRVQFVGKRITPIIGLTNEVDVQAWRPPAITKASDHPLSHFSLVQKLHGFRGHLLRQNVIAIVTVKQGSFTKIHNDADKKIMASINALHHARIEAKADALTPLARSLSLALITGEKNYVPEPIQENFIRTGTYHTLAISGMHVGMLLLISIFSLQLFRLPLRTSFAISVLALLPAMLIFLPLSVPTVRAYVMALVAYLLTLFKRDCSLEVIVATTMLIFLASSPYEVYTASFQFSFSAMFAISWTVIFFKSTRIEDRLVQSVFITIATFFATVPFNIATFAVFYPAGLFYNLFIPPLMMLLLLYCLLFFFSPFTVVSAHFTAAVNFLASLVVLLIEKSKIDTILPSPVYFVGTLFERYRLIVFFVFVLIIWRFFLSSNLLLLKNDKIVQSGDR